MFVLVRLSQMASVKNFQLVTPADHDTVVLQFGRVGKDLFTMVRKSCLPPKPFRHPAPRSRPFFVVVIVPFCLRGWVGRTTNGRCAHSRLSPSACPGVCTRVCDVALFAAPHTLCCPSASTTSWRASDCDVSRPPTLHSACAAVPPLPLCFTRKPQPPYRFFSSSPTNASYGLTNGDHD